jgi:hypothetical protein
MCKVSLFSAVVYDKFIIISMIISLQYALDVSNQG